VLASGEVKPVATPERLAALRAELRHVTVQPELIAYAVDVVRATRSNESVLVGAGPRASQALLLAARALAALQDRDFVTPDDLKFLAGPVLGHRLVLRPEFELEGTSIGEVVTRILEGVAVPR
jgi:MoxR-like ATPase